MGIRHVADYSDQVTIVLRSTFQNCVAVLWILICNSLYHTAQMFHDTLFPPSSLYDQRK